MPQWDDASQLHSLEISCYLDKKIWYAHCSAWPMHLHFWHCVCYRSKPAKKQNKAKQNKWFIQTWEQRLFYSLNEKDFGKRNSLCSELYLKLFAIKIAMLFWNYFPIHYTKFMHLSDLSDIKELPNPFSSSDILQKLKGSYWWYWVFLISDL